MIFELVDTLIGGLACSLEKKIMSAIRGEIEPRIGLREGGILGQLLTERGTLGDGALAATTADTDAINDIALLCLVTESTSLVGARRSRSAMNDVQLSELY